MAEPLIAPAPDTRRGDDHDVYHGVTVADPYRWLEDGDSPEVAAWVAAHNDRTREALDARPSWGRWHGRLAALTALPTVLGARVRGDRLFVDERPAGADQFVLTLRSATDPAVAPRTLLDPALLAADGAVAIDWFHPSPDGALVAFGLSEGGTENSTLHVLRVDTGEQLAEAIADTRAASVAWLPDGSGFWYTRYPAGDEYHRHVRFHTIGTDPAGDPVVLDEFPTPESWPDVTASDDGRYVLVETLVGWGRIDARLLDTATGIWADVISGVEARSGFIFVGDQLVGVTTVDAPNGRLVVAPLDDPATWRTIVAERDVVLGAVVDRGGDVLLVATREAIDTVEAWRLDGSGGEPVGDIGLSSVQSLTADVATGAAFVTTVTFDAPATVHRLDADGLPRWCPAPPAAAVLPKLTVRHVTYPSLDGTPIGLFVVHRADVTPSPNTPLILTGYGGFAIAETPAWMPNLAAWCAAGGVYAIAGLRGGIEHGEEWHRAGRRGNKQNVFDDFHAGADWLVAAGYTSRALLAIVGGSNGGLLMGVAITQRPDLARAVWCAVPLLDMIRFPQFLIARLWTDEYGDPDVAEEFGWLHAYSPYHRVAPGTTYPAVLFSTAEGDSRVDPLHARKMTALLTAASGSQDERPVLLSQSGRAGHGVGKPASMRIREGADVLTFLSWQLDVESLA
ncbi:MAG: prolyl oligopeptidase family serine peptidase [Ilumatobacteraceae bacterium]